jgi:hypothetical protein
MPLALGERLIVCLKWAGHACQSRNCLARRVAAEAMAGAATIAFWAPGESMARVSGGSADTIP